VKFGRNAPYEDVALRDEAFLRLDETGLLCAPAFQIDWKDDSDVKKAFDWPELSRELRVRHQHDMETRRAKDEQLFAYDMVAPHEGVAWQARVDLSHVPQDAKPHVWGGLKVLLELGFLGIGKTKARSGGVVVATCTSEPISAKVDCFVVTLQTPAFLCDPNPARKSNVGSLPDHYKEIWAEISKLQNNGTQCLEMVRFFARQSLFGGYLGQRFGKGKPYNPFLLTAAGSVFVLKAVDGMQEEAQAVLADWQNHGLPLPSWVKDRYGDNWKENPFVPENGYGEVAVNLPRPRDNQAHCTKTAEAAHV
jgi:hypothetical protein